MTVIFPQCNNIFLIFKGKAMWEVEYTDEFGIWWDTLSEKEQISVAAHVELLEKLGPNLKFPYSSGIKNSKYSHIRELRIQHAGNPYRILYIFDTRRIALLLIGGKKTGNTKWYDEFISIAEKLYTKHLKTLEKHKV